MTSTPANGPGSKRRLLFCLFIVVWFLKLASGIIDVTQRHVPPYVDAVRALPDVGRMELYIAIPAAFVALNVLLLLIANRLPKWLAITLAAMQLLLLLTLMFIGSGGI